MSSVRIAFRADKRHPCPICRGNHSCSATDDGLHFCWRTHFDVAGWIYLGDAKNGFGLFRSEADMAERANNLDGDQKARGTAGTERRASPRVDAAQILAEYPAGRSELRILAERLGVSVASLEALEVGYKPQLDEDDVEAWLLPERDAEGKVIGIARRFPNGQKRQWPGTARGLSVPSHMVTEPPGGRTVLIVEGASDTAACLTLGLSAIGRPSNLAGLDIVSHLVASWQRRNLVCECLVVGENDRKDDDRWPGREGAERTAEALADALGYPVAFTLPPDGIKDIRSWLVLDGVNAENRLACEAAGQRLLTQLHAAHVFGETLRKPLSHFAKDRKNGSVSESDSISSLISVQNATRNLKVSRQNVLSSASFGPQAQRIVSEGRLRAKCPRQRAPRLRDRDDRQHYVAFLFDCDSWNCPVCRVRKRSRVLISLACSFPKVTGPLFTVAVSANALAAIKRRVQRLDGNFVAVRQANGLVAMIASVNLPGAVAVNQASATEQLAGSLLNMASNTARPVSTSHDWGFSHRERRDRYVLEGELSPAAECYDRLRRELSAYRVPHASRPADRGERTDLHFPPEWDELQIAAFFLEIEDPR